VGGGGAGSPIQPKIKTTKGGRGVGGGKTMGGGAWGEQKIRGGGGDSKSKGGRGELYNPKHYPNPSHKINHGWGGVGGETSGKLGWGGRGGGGGGGR